MKRHLLVSTETEWILASGFSWRLSNPVYTPQTGCDHTEWQLGWRPMLPRSPYTEPEPHQEAFPGEPTEAPALSAPSIWATPRWSAMLSSHPQCLHWESGTFLLQTPKLRGCMDISTRVFVWHLKYNPIAIFKIQDIYANRERVPICRFAPKYPQRPGLCWGWS